MKDVAVDNCGKLHFEPLLHFGPLGAARSPSEDLKDEIAKMQQVGSSFRTLSINLFEPWPIIGGWTLPFSMRVSSG